MSRTAERSGFTLVEVIASIGIFAVAFLIGASAISSFMLKQEESFQRTVAASAAMLLVDHCYRIGPPNATATGPNLTGGVSGVLKPAHSTWWSKIRFKGGPKEAIGPSDHCFVFDRSALTVSSHPTSAGVNNIAVGGATINIAEYKSIIVVISDARHVERHDTALPASGTTLFSPEGIDWRRMTFWYGYAPDVENGNKTTVSFLGSYLYADGIHDL